jgi:hypothetical protein
LAVFDTSAADALRRNDSGNNNRNDNRTGTVRQQDWPPLAALDTFAADTLRQGTESWTAGQAQSVSKIWLYMGTIGCVSNRAALDTSVADTLRQRKDFVDSRTCTVCQQDLAVHGHHRLCQQPGGLRHICSIPTTSGQGKKRRQQNRRSMSARFCYHRLHWTLPLGTDLCHGRDSLDRCAVMKPGPACVNVLWQRRAQAAAFDHHLSQ